MRTFNCNEVECCHQISKMIEHEQLVDLLLLKDLVKSNVWKERREQQAEDMLAISRSHSENLEGEKIICSSCFASLKVNKVKEDHQASRLKD